jgi:hypothetical protein
MTLVGPALLGAAFVGAASAAIAPVHLAVRECGLSRLKPLPQELLPQKPLGPLSERHLDSQNSHSINNPPANLHAIIGP